MLVKVVVVMALAEEVLAEAAAVAVAGVHPALVWLQLQRPAEEVAAAATYQVARSR